MVDRGQCHSGTPLNLWSNAEEAELQMAFWKHPRDAFSVLVRESYEFVNEDDRPFTDLCRGFRKATGLEVMRRDTALFWLHHHLRWDTMIRRASDGMVVALGSVLASGQYKKK